MKKENKQKRLVLLVDDDPLMIELVEFLLQKRNFAVVSCMTGKKALHLAQTRSPDIILLDIMMPDIDGFEICKFLKTNTETKDIPILIISALSQDSDILNGLQAGAEGYIMKPFRPEELVKRINCLIKK